MLGEMSFKVFHILEYENIFSLMNAYGQWEKIKLHEMKNRKKKIATWVLVFQKCSKFWSIFGRI